MQTRHSKKFVISGFAFVLITLFAAGVGGLSQLNQLNKQQLEITEHYLLKHDLIHRMLTASRERAITLNQIANLTDPFERDEQIMRYHRLGAQFAGAREQFLALPLASEEVALLKQQGEEVGKGISSQHEAIELATAEQFDKARDLLTHTAIPTQKRVFALLQSLYELQTAVYEREQADTAESNSQTYLALLIMLGIFSLCVGGITAVVVIRQISQSEKALYQANERFDLAMRGANDGLWDWDIESDTVYYSPRWKEMLGFAEGELDDTLDSWESRIHPDDLKPAEAAINAHLQGQTALYENIQRMRLKDGSYHWHLERGIAVRDDVGRPYRMVGTNTDITRQKQTEEALFEAKERALVTLHSIGDAVITTDDQGLITYLNPIAERLIGIRSDEASARPLEECCRMIDEDHDRPAPNPALGALERGEVYELKCSTQLITHNGSNRSITASAAPIRDSNGTAIGAVIVLRDVSESREMARRLSWQASHDALTGLYNRQEMEKHLELMLEEAQRDAAQHILLYLDLDQFKLVNDTSGHLAGDELLRQLSYLLKKTLRETDLLARLGGDEFGILLNHCTIDKAVEIAEKLRTLIHEFRFVWQDKSFEIGVSIGIAPIDQRTESSAAVMSAADVACYAAKDLGRNRYHIYVQEDEELTRRHGEMAWVSRIRSAIEENRLVLYRQAIQSVQSEQAHEVHTEILVRMVDEEGELIAPGQFIPAAERYNLMPQIDRKIIELTLAHMAKDKDAPHSVAINLSGNTFGDEQFLAFVKQQLARFNIAAERICFEITETAAITKLSSAIHFMQELKTLGCRFALDDFGSGLSSFSYLKNLPVDYLKIDGAFIRDIVDDPYDRAMVEAISRVGRVMGLKTIAEFVENDAILEELRVIGIDYVQGYGIEKPRPLFQPTYLKSVKRESQSI